MSNELDPNVKKNLMDDTIEFGSVLKAINYSISQIGKLISKSINVITSNLVRFILIGVISGAAGYGFSYIFSPSYNSKMTVMSAFLGNDDCYNIVSNLADAIEKSSPERKGEILNMKPEEAKQIKKIRFYNIKERINPKDSIMVDVPFKVYVEVKNPEVLDGLEFGILTHMRKNELSRRIEFQKRKNASNMVNKLEKQIEDLDSLKYVVADNLFPRGTNQPSGFVYGEPISPVDFFKEGIVMYKNQQAFQDSLDLYFENFLLVDKFIKKDKPDSPKRLNWAVFFAFFASFILFVKLFNKN
jgi:hypothetical protein